MTVFLGDDEITGTPDCGYRFIRDGNRPEEIVARDLCNTLWEIFKKYSDPHFKQQLVVDFCARFWEMDLTVLLLKQGFKIESSKRGPDICIITKGDKKIWIEAIAPTAGNGEDKVPEYSCVNCKSEKNEDKLPEDLIILRYTTAIAEKYKKYGKNIIARDEPYIIAINGSRIPYARFDGPDIPIIVKSVFPIGSMYARFDLGNLKDKENIKTGRKFRASVQKQNGTKIPTDVFTTSAFSGISAIIFSCADCCNRPTKGNGLTVIHNPFAANPVPLGTIECDHEYYAHIEGDDGTLYCNSREEKHLILIPFYDYRITAQAIEHILFKRLGVEHILFHASQQASKMFS